MLVHPSMLVRHDLSIYNQNKNWTLKTKIARHIRTKTNKIEQYHKKHSTP